MRKFLLPMNLQLFADEAAVDSGVEVVPAAEVQAIPQVEPSSESGANAEAAAEPEKLNNFEKAFAKRLAAKEAEIEAKYAEKLKDYDTHKELSEYFQQINGADALTLKERIEMDRLQERADQNEISPEMQRRLETLEAKAAKADELEQQSHQEKWESTYWTGIKEFAKDDADRLNQFMLDNGLYVDPDNMNRSFDIALKAMKHDDLQQELSTAKESAVKEYLSSKQGVPRVEGGNGAAGTQRVDTSKMTWEQVEKQAVERLRAARQPQ